MPSKSLTFLQQNTTNGQGHLYERSPAWRSQPTVLVPVELQHAPGKEHSPDAGTFKQGSRPSASLLRSSKSCTSGESVSSLEPKLRLLLKSKSPKPQALGPKDDLCQCIIATIQKGSEGPKHEAFSDVSENDYHFILDAIQFDDHLARKLSYVPHLQQLFVNLPTPVHESILAPLCTTMGAIIQSIPLPSVLHTALCVHMNIMVKKDEDSEDDEDKCNLGIPDMLIQRETQDAEFHPLWPFEISFSQSSEAAEAKIQLFANKNPHIKGGTHFHIAEAQTHKLPCNEWAIEQELDKKKVGHIKQVDGSAGGDRISSCSHIWLQPLKVTITTWLQPPNGRLKTTNCRAQYYASAVLFPQQDAAGLQNVQHLFRCTLERIRDSTVRHLEVEHPSRRNDPLMALIKPLKQWTVPDTVVVWDTCVDGLETAAKQTASRRYLPGVVRPVLPKKKKVKAEHTLHGIMKTCPNWGKSLAYLHVFLRIFICCGHTDNPHLLINVDYSECRLELTHSLWPSCLARANITIQDLEMVLNKDSKLPMYGTFVRPRPIPWEKNICIHNNTVNRARHQQKQDSPDNTHMVALGTIPRGRGIGEDNQFSLQSN
ncbi:uncharacterized protein F5891DRAFT_1186847 [Suillus fuscotomentosus]|uniref:Uncharacterized protein n=1 Tax=Suillus fuscotomentosus TaxID=1912939 RepID=A0AAD4HLN8_9AGAM|nr:uncharacterized protein F5891DRAFT_1186847 [Suillus fuscotomentosus]KAG1902265.1 hypothetical protein F5891DRAFT_1186847 [Suillus fuscotomentosus]